MCYYADIWLTFGSSKTMQCEAMDQAPPHSWAYRCKTYALEGSHCFSTIALRTRQASEVNSHNVKAWLGPSSWLQLVSDGLAGRLRCRQHRPEPIELNASIAVQSSMH